MTTLTLNTQHVSLQYSDNREQQVADVEKLFAKGGRFPIKTGTEAGPETFSNDALIECAKDYGHVIHFNRANWVAVDRKIIVPKSVKKGQVFVAKNDIIVGKMHDRAFPSIAFTHVEARIGRVSQAAIHYPTKGRTPGDPNNDINKMYAEKITEWMKQASSRSAISFVNGDFNMVDSIARQDWAFGNGWTSMADELGNHQNTGHGPIDGMCSYDRDRRVKAKRFWVLDDSEMHMHTDHYVCRGQWSIKAPKGSK